MRNAAPETTFTGAFTPRGFRSGIGPHPGRDEASCLAQAAIARTSGCGDVAVRAFLLSRYGRHFGEEAAMALTEERCLAAAVDVAVGHWMERRIDERIETELGIPEGMPCLIGFVRLHDALLAMELG